MSLLLLLFVDGVYKLFALKRLAGFKILLGCLQDFIGEFCGTANEIGEITMQSGQRCFNGHPEAA